MLSAVAFMLGLGALCGGMLCVASKVFYVYEDPRIAEVEGFTAGANCGGCGYTGCAAAAVAVVAGGKGGMICPSAARSRLPAVWPLDNKR